MGEGLSGGGGFHAFEDNELILRATEAMGGRRYKTWRIYELPPGLSWKPFCSLFDTLPKMAVWKIFDSGPAIS